MNQLVFDRDAAEQIEALYRIGDAERRRRLVRGALATAPGERILDVGCGPGYYCAELAEEVGPSGAVVGVDPSAPMRELAERRLAGHSNAEVREGEAVALPVEDGTFDAAVCVQVLEYVPDAGAAIAELFRALRPGGRLVVWDIDWATVSLNADDRDRCARVLRAWDEHLSHRSLPRTLSSLLGAAGFGEVAMEPHAFATAEFDPDSYGVALVPFIAGFVGGRQGVSEEEARAWEDEQRALGERGEFYFSSTQSCFTASKL